MRKIFVSVFCVLFFLVFGFFSAKSYAAEVKTTFSSELSSDGKICRDTGKFKIIFSSDDGAFNKSVNYAFLGHGDGNGFLDRKEQLSKVTETPNPSDPSKIHQEISIDMDTKPMTHTPFEKWTYTLWVAKSISIGSVPKDATILASGDLTIYPEDACTVGLPILEMLSPLQMGESATITVRNIYPDKVYDIWFVGGHEQEFLPGKKFTDKNAGPWTIGDDPLAVAGGTGKIATWSGQLNNKNYGLKKLCLKHGKYRENCEIEIPVEIVLETVPPEAQELVKSGELGAELDDSLPPDDVPIPDAPLPCKMQNTDGTCAEVYSAIGVIKTDPGEFVKKIYEVVLGLAGGIALIMIILSGYKYMASQGNPEAIKAATEGLTSSVIGLLFIIFAFVILQIIGVDILRIPGFSK